MPKPPLPRVYHVCFSRIFAILLVICGSLFRLGAGQQFPFQPPFGFPFGNAFPQQPPFFNPANPSNFRAVNRPIGQFPLGFRQPFPGFSFPPFTNTLPVANSAQVSSTLAQQQLLNFVNLLVLATTFRRIADSNNQSPPPIEWTSWSSWTSCSREECGFQQRSRTCDGGNSCLGNNQETLLCNQVPSCSFIGVWSNWGSWGQCSPLCNGGVKTRSRTCSAGNLQCSGVPLDFQLCRSDNPNRFEFEGRCYEVFNVDYRTRFDAVQAMELCKATRGALADIRSQAHQDLLIREAKKTAPEQYKRFGFWIGMSVDASGNVLLSNGQPAPYLDWAAGSDISLTRGCPCTPVTNIALAITKDSSKDGIHALPDIAPRRGAICEYDP